MKHGEMVTRLVPGVYRVASERAIHLHPDEYLQEHGHRVTANARRRLVREAREKMCGESGLTLVVVAVDGSIEARYDPDRTRAVLDRLERRRQ